MPRLILFPSPMIVTKMKFELSHAPNQKIPYFEIRGCNAEGNIAIKEAVTMS